MSTITVSDRVRLRVLRRLTVCHWSDCDALESCVLNCMLCSVWGPCEARSEARSERPLRALALRPGRALTGGVAPLIGIAKRLGLVA